MGYFQIKNGLKFFTLVNALQKLKAPQKTGALFEAAYFA
jgi:hypothetical protein